MLPPGELALRVEALRVLGPRHELYALGAAAFTQRVRDLIVPPAQPLAEAVVAHLVGSAARCDRVALASVGGTPMLLLRDGSEHHGGHDHYAYFPAHEPNATGVELLYLHGRHGRALLRDLDPPDPADPDRQYDDLYGEVARSAAPSPEPQEPQAAASAASPPSPPSPVSALISTGVTVQGRRTRLMRPDFDAMAAAATSPGTHGWAPVQSPVGSLARLLERLGYDGADAAALTAALKLPARNTAKYKMLSLHTRGDGLHTRLAALLLPRPVNCWCTGWGGANGPPTPPPAGPRGGGARRGGGSGGGRSRGEEEGSGEEEGGNGGGGGRSAPVLVFLPHASARADIGLCTLRRGQRAALVPAEGMAAPVLLCYHATPAPGWPSMTRMVARSAGSSWQLVRASAVCQQADSSD